MVSGSDDPGIAGSGAQSEDALWVGSFLLTQPGKTYRLESSDDAREAAAIEAVEDAARGLAERVVRRAQAPRTFQVDVPDQPF